MKWNRWEKSQGKHGVGWGGSSHAVCGFSLVSPSLSPRGQALDPPVPRPAEARLPSPGIQREQPVPVSSLTTSGLSLCALPRVFPFFRIPQLTHPSSAVFISGTFSRRRMETDWRKVGSGE